MYLAHLSREIQEPGPGKSVLPGVPRLLDTLAARDDVCLALLTGNVEKGARIKLEYFDLWRYFPCGGFGDSAPNRVDIFADAVAAASAYTGVDFEPGAIVVIGDTPLDVAVAFETGTRSVAVATGSYADHALREAGADVVLTDFSNMPAALAALNL